MVKRRKVLAGFGSVGSVAIAGCSSEDPDYEEGNTPEEESESETQEEESDSQSSDENTEDEESNEGTSEPEENETEDTGEAVFEVVDTDDGATFLSTEEMTFGGVIENTGDASGEKEVQIQDPSGNVIDSAEVELEPGETFDASLTYNPNAFEPGEYEVILITEDDSESFTITVEQGGPSEEDIEIQEHELVVDEGEFVTDVYVEGIVANNADQMADYVQVTVRIYDNNGNQLDSYIDNTNDLAANTTWAFEVMILEDADDIGDYDIAVEDIRF